MAAEVRCSQPPAASSRAGGRRARQRDAGEPGRRRRPALPADARARVPALFADAATYQSIIRDWNASVAARGAGELVAGRGDHRGGHRLEAAAEDPRKAAQLADVLSVAALLIDLRASPDALAASLAGHRPLARLGLAAEACTALLEQSAAEIAALRSALGQ
ncbi:MAG: hypothetical protein U1F06_02115 [Steroidobacteraceae bacterium]